MATGTLNLINGGFQHSNLFIHMPLFDEIFYRGQRDGKVRLYHATREGLTCQILALNIIRSDEKFFWEAIEDFIERATMQAGTSAHGVHTFDLLTIDIHKEIKTFNYQELATLILNTTRALKPGEQKLLKYSSAYGILQKIGTETWGKVALKTTVEVFKDKPEYLDILIKLLLKDFSFSHDPVILLLNDVSTVPLFDKTNDMQQERLKAVMKKLIPDSIDFPPEVYIQDKNGMRELLSGFSL
jgi:hypothetical protein